MDDQTPQPAALVLAPGEAYPPDYRDLAFESYLRLDGNLSAVSRELAISDDTLLRWSRQDQWRDRIAAAEADLTASARRRVHRILRDHVPELIETMLAIARGQVEGATVSDRRLATRDLLDRAGYAPIRQLLIDQRTASLSVSATLDPDQPKPTTDEAIAILQRIMSDDARER